MPETVTRSPISLDKHHLDILISLQAQIQSEETDKSISRSEVVRRALKALAKIYNI